MGWISSTISRPLSQNQLFTHTSKLVRRSVGQNAVDNEARDIHKALIGLPWFDAWKPEENSLRHVFSNVGAVVNHDPQRRRAITVHGRCPDFV